MADQDRQIENPENLTWEALERRSLFDPVIAVYLTHAHLGNISREAAAIGSALTLSRMHNELIGEKAYRLASMPASFEQVRAFLQAIATFQGSTPAAMDNANAALDLLAELAGRRAKEVTGAT